jgi:EAL domain-containing protein (putative c-di-GMP-specific phosphodiesterase class I)
LFRWEYGLEITENVLANVKGTISILKEIRELGIRISVDNFGTGYSAFNPLATNMFHLLKECTLK